MTQSAWLCSASDTPLLLESIPFVDTERLLEDWIEADPSIAGDGLVVVGRQVSFEGGPADLLAIDPQGRWVVIEIKRGRNVRQDFAQVLDYGSSLAYEPADALRARLAQGLRDKPHRDAALAAVDAALADEGELPREVAHLITGVGAHTSTERIQQYLHHHGVDMRVVTLEAFRAADGRILLLRDADSAETQTSAETSAGEVEAWDERLARIRQTADDCGVLAEFDRWLAAVDRAGLMARPYKHSVMVGPPTHKNAYLMVGRPVADHGIRFNHGTQTFPQWFPWIPVDAVERALGPAVRGMGTVYAGEELHRYVSAVERFLAEHFPPPAEFASFMTQQQWNRDLFIAAFTNRPDIQSKVVRMLDAAIVEYGTGATGQAHLKFSEDGPQILQITTQGHLRGMWSLGTQDPEDPAWQPLTDLLSAWGGLGPQGQATRVDLGERTDADVEAALRAGEEISRLLESSRP